MVDEALNKVYYEMLMNNCNMKLFHKMECYLKVMYELGYQSGCEHMKELLKEVNQVIK